MSPYRRYGRYFINDPLPKAIMEKIRVLLAEDHQLFREALQALLEADPEIEIVASASNGDEVLQRVSQAHPDVICMDIRMPGLSGIEATRQLLAAQPGVKIVGLSAHSDAEWIMQMIDAGALGYVDKLSAAEELGQAIRSVHANQRYLCSNAPSGVAQALSRSRPATA
jgi:DNA-binding NarL/FixJ family response regulator